MNFNLSKESVVASRTDIENAFITEYLPSADGDAVKVYLYGLYLSKNIAADVSLAEFSKNVGLEPEKITDIFKFWQEFDLVTFTESPFAVTYLPISANYARARKYKPEKYTEFCSMLQNLFPSRAIGINEYTEYFNLMEIYSISQDAMLMIVKYCIDKKGEDISYRYISKVAKDFGSRGLTTCEKVEAELNKYVTKTADIEKILAAMDSKKQPEMENIKQLNKWINELGFTMEAVLAAASSLKKGNFDKLDAFMMELYGLKCFGVEDIKSYVNKKRELYDASVKIAKALSLYFEVIDTVVENYTSKWFDHGYTQDGLLFIANYCFKQGRNSLEDMNNVIETLFKNGVISYPALTEYFLRLEKDDEFIKTVLSEIGIKRNVTPWDRSNLSVWRGWNFSDDMILEAAKRAVGKNSPVQYMNAILGNWKNKSVYTAEGAAALESSNGMVSTPQVSPKVTTEMIAAKYGERRIAANQKVEDNLKKAEKITGFKKNYQKLKEVEIDVIMSEFGGDKSKLEDLKAQKQTLETTVGQMLAGIGLTKEDLSPIYKCKKCNDTGFDGSEKCSCYNEVLEECLKEISKK